MQAEILVTVYMWSPGAVDSAHVMNRFFLLAPRCAGEGGISVVLFTGCVINVDS